jgi:integrase/recombinase XerD
MAGSAIQVDRKTDLKPGPLPERPQKPMSRFKAESLFDRLNDKQKVAVGKLEAALQLERKEYSTVKSYRNCFIQFIFAHSELLPSLISAEQIRAYFLKRIREDHISKSTQGQLLSALKAFYERVLTQPEKTATLYYPAKEPYLPKVLTKEEVTKVFGVVGNLKHKCLLMLLYGSGLRVGQVVNLKIQDLNPEEGTLFVHRSKGNKDRNTLLSTNAAECIRRYIDEYKPRLWLFESPEGGHYSTRSVQQIFTNALRDARIDKRLGTHALRHSFATHLLQSTGNLDLVRKVLGHNSIETTQIYLHVSKEDLRKTQSPLDDLKL